MSTVDDITQPLSGHLLPREAYFSPEWHEREQRELFGRCWKFVGMIEDFAQEGGYRAVQVGPHPILVIRDRNGELRAHHNLCSHRGAALLQGAGTVKKAIVCPYHRWTYGFDGCLKHVPQVDEFPGGIDRAALGLRPARIETFKGMVFAHPDPDAELLMDWLGDFPTHMGPFEPTKLVEILAESHPIQANWKTFIENHQDGYHLGYVHADNLRGYDHKAQEHFLYGRHWSFFEPLREGAEPPDVKLTRMPIIDHVEPRWHGSSVHMLFPNLALAAGATFWLTLEAVPTGPESCRLDMRVRTMPVAPMVRQALRVAKRAEPLLVDLAARAKAGDQALRRARTERKLDLRSLVKSIVDAEKPYDVLSEDAFCCEAIQKGLRSPNFDMGPLAPRYERAILAFQQNVLDYVGGPGEPAGPGPTG